MTWFIAFYIFSFAQAVPVYLDPVSSFSTEDYSERFLQKRTKKIISKSWEKIISKNEEEGWIRSSSLVYPIQLSTKVIVKENCHIFKEPVLNLSAKNRLATNSSVYFISLQENWAKIKSRANSKQFHWINKKCIEEDPNDFGKLLTIKNTIFYLNIKEYISKPIIIKPYKWFNILEVKEDGFKIQYNGKLGYVGFKTVLSKFHWIDSIIDKKNNNYKISNVDGARIQISNNKYIAIDQIKALWTLPNNLMVWPKLANLHQHPSDQAVVLGKAKGLDVVQKKESALIKWGEVFLPKQRSSVWWAFEGEYISTETKTAVLFQPQILLAESNISTQSSISTQELFRQKIFDMATSSIVANLMFASANGIYRSTDGKNWLKLNQFRNENHPITISGAGHIFIGPYKSEDNGQTFRQYIRWDKLVQTVHMKKYTHIKDLRLNEIKVLSRDGQILKLTLKLQNDIIKVISLNGGKSWSLD